MLYLNRKKSDFVDSVSDFEAKENHYDSVACTPQSMTEDFAICASNPLDVPELVCRFQKA